MTALPSSRRLRFIVGALGVVLAGVVVDAVAHRKAARRSQQTLRTQEYEPPPHGMVLVPAGDFLMGSDEARAEPDERPLRKVFLPAFYIDRFEVTNRRYREFDPAHSNPPGTDELPVTHVLKRDAEAYCRFTGKRLPTGAEWEKAARGTDGRTFPWGNEFLAGYANVKTPNSSSQIKFEAMQNFDPGGSKFWNSNSQPWIQPGQKCDLPAGSTNPTGLRAVGSFPRGASPYGCEDMSGNAWEWVSDVHRDKNFLGLDDPASARGILRGGGFGYSAFQLRVSYLGLEGLGTTCHDTGFRCAMTAVPKRKPAH